MRPQNDIKTLLFDSTLILFGVFGTIGCFVYTFALPIHTLSLMCMLLLTIVYFFVINSWHKPVHLISITSLVVYVLILVVTFNTCKSGLSYMMNCIFQTYEANSQFSFLLFDVNIALSKVSSTLNFALWMLFVPVIMVVVYAVRKRKLYFLSFVVTLPFLFLILLFTLIPPWNMFIMMLLFYVAMLGMHVASRFDAQRSSDSIRKLGFVFTICCMAIIVVIQIVKPSTSYVRDEQVDTLRLQVQANIRDMLYGAPSQQSGSVDLGDAKNRFYIGNVELRIKSDQKSTIYLHGYSGTLYKDNTWYTPELSFYENKIDFQTAPHPFDFANYYYEQVDATQKAVMKKQNIEVTYEDAFKYYVYTPYYALESITKNNTFTPFIDAYVAPVNEEVNVYAFSVLSQETILAQDTFDSTYAKAYMDAVMFTNLTVPTIVESALRDTSIPGITKTSSDEEKIKAIQKYMQSFGTYTLSPGETPKHKDFISYFLENKQGYCVHYASTATMLLRLYGIPARYAQGYRVDPADFEDGIALAKDYNAHAWVEVFDERFGWVPLEVTPASAYGTNTRNTTLQNQDPQIQSQNQNKSPNENAVDKPTVTKDNEQKIDFNAIMAPLILVLLIIGSLLSIIIRRVILVRNKDRKQHSENRKEAALEVAKNLSYFVKDGDLPKDIKMILEEARFSTHQIREEQYVLLMQYQKMLKNREYTTFTRRQKLLYKWWYCV